MPRNFVKVGIDLYLSHFSSASRPNSASYYQVGKLRKDVDQTIFFHFSLLTNLKIEIDSKEQQTFLHF